eukprot:TRINITY_DN80221_c0_g1_i1.p1 TRINITY_DN80221_c0_g1~~TRINITY_DN80221_c0_g1_i1.p1  ORF type:complete len:681 (+),score=182.91 TRINITY_DN80221_c0_g1_i1:109-2151(+)
MEEESPIASKAGSGLRMLGGQESRAQVLLSAFQEAKRAATPPSTRSEHSITNMNMERRAQTPGEKSVGERSLGGRSRGSNWMGSADGKPASEATTNRDRMFAATSPGSFFETRKRPGTESSLGGGDAAAAALGQKPLPSGMQDLVPVKSVPDIYKAVRILVGMVANCWGGSNFTAASFQQLGMGLSRVHVGNETFVLNSYLLLDLEHMITKGPAQQGVVQEVYLKKNTKYFKSILTILKLRWLMRFHSACCELDYKMCSCANLIRGLQTCALQQYAEAECDNVFDSKVSQQAGAHLNLESVLDDIFDQFQRCTGAGWKNFLQFVSTCDPARSVYNSPMDLAESPIVSNEALMNVCDVIFVTCFLRQRREELGATSLKELVRELQAFGLPVPKLPALRRAENLRVWAKARTKPTPKDRDRASKKNMQFLAQLDAMVLCAAVEMQLPEVIASSQEMADMDSSIALPKKLAGDASRDVLAMTGLGLATAGDGPPAAKVTFDDKPQISPVVFQACVYCIQHHKAFPGGIRERLYALLVGEYGLTRQQFEELAIASTQSIEGERLSKHVLNQMWDKEKARLRKYEEVTYKDCSHLLKSELVAPPAEFDLPARYARAPLLTVRPQSTADLTKSLPDLRGFSTRRGGLGKEPFKVPLVTGPLSRDPDTHKLRTTGFFVRMPPLRGQA